MKTENEAFVGGKPLEHPELDFLCCMLRLNHFAGPPSGQVQKYEILETEKSILYFSQEERPILGISYNNT